MAVVTELLGRPALHEYTKKANKLELNNMLKLKCYEVIESVCSPQQGPGTRVPQVISLLRRDWTGNNSVKWRTGTGFTNELHACIISSGTQGLEASGFHGFFIFHFAKYNIEGLFLHSFKHILEVNQKCRPHRRSILNQRSNKATIH